MPFGQRWPEEQRPTTKTPQMRLPSLVRSVVAALRVSPNGRHFGSPLLLPLLPPSDTAFVPEAVWAPLRIAERDLERALWGRPPWALLPGAPDANTTTSPLNHFIVALS